MRRRRNAVLQPERARFDRLVGDQVAQLAASMGAQTVGLYASHRSEAPLWAALANLQAAGVVTVLPRVDGQRMVLRRVNTVDDLVAGYRGVLEPAAGCGQVPLEHCELLLVPGLGFGRDGSRLGQGGGHYDRLLADPRLRCISVGVAFEVQRVNRDLVFEAHDRRVDGLLTEAGFYGTGRWTPPTPHDTPGL